MARVDPALDLIEYGKQLGSCRHCMKDRVLQGNRVHRVMRRHAVPVQHSVFHAMATRSELLAIFDEIDCLIDARHDHVRGYPLSMIEKPTMFGADALAPGIMLGYTQARGLTTGGPSMYPKSARSDGPDRRKGRPSALFRKCK